MDGINILINELNSIQKKIQEIAKVDIENQKIDFAILKRKSIENEINKISNAITDTDKEIRTIKNKLKVTFDDVLYNFKSYIGPLFLLFTINSYSADYIKPITNILANFENLYIIEDLREYDVSKKQKLDIY